MKFTLANPSKIAFALLALIGITAFGSCNKNTAQTNSATTSAASGNKQNQQAIIDFQRTPCYGTCPIYRATVQRDGKINFTGKQFIDLIGTYEARIPEAEVQQLLKEIDQAKFLERDTVYVTGATDFPSMILRVRNHGKYHTVRTEGEGPQEIETLMKRIDNTILTAVRNNSKRTINGQPVGKPEGKQMD